MSLACVYKSAEMTIDQTALLDRITTLKSANQSLQGELEARTSELDARDAEIARLQQNVDALKRMIWGGSEKRPADAGPLAPGQLLLAGILEGAMRGPAAAGADTTTEIHVPAHTRRKKGRRSEFPDHLPVLRTEFELSGAGRDCKNGCGQMKRIGEEARKELERIEFSLVHEIVTAKYACEDCHDGVVTAPGPARVIDKGILGVGFLAHVLTERFMNHMPYHRQEKKYASEGLSLSRSVLSASSIRCAGILKPIVDQLRREVIGSDIVHTDDTPVTMLADSAGVRRTGRVWIYRDIEGRCFFHCTESRCADGPREVFGDFKGYIVADAFPGYDKFFTQGGATEVACWAHTRRKFITAESSEPKLAKEAVDQIRELYAIEKLAKGMTPANRQGLRARESKPRLADIRNWMAATRVTVLDKGPLARAIDYALSNWDALERYLEDGRLPIDNNPAERALRCVALGRKNWMFIGNQAGGDAAAGMYSLVETCKAADVNPREYFRDVLLRIGACSDVTKLTPHGWKKHFLPEVEERRHEALQKLLGAP